VLAAAGILGYWFVTLPDVAGLAESNPTTTALIEARRAAAVEKGLPLGVSWAWTPLARIAPNLQKAVLMSEDASFYQHQGFDWDGLKEAFSKNWETGKLQRGGSTITQQLAKNLYLSSDKTLLRKAHEVLLAWELERRLPKQRILELYLNVAEWGHGIFGVEAAARHHFGKSAAELTEDEAALLAAVLPAPRRYDPLQVTPYLARRQQHILYWMRRGNGRASALAQRPSGRDEVGWVGLYNAALVEWLENENRLNDLCLHTTAGTTEWHECRDDKMKPKQYVLPLRSAPNETATSEGALLIVAVPGQGLRSYYRSARAGTATEFVPDLFDADWGYGPYFHQTFLERRGTWFLLPAAPLPKPAWVDVREFAGDPQVRLLGIGEIISTPTGDVVVLGIERGILRVRPEQNADMWCEEGEPPPLQPSEEVRVPVDELYGPTRHLLVRVKYTRGC